VVGDSPAFIEDAPDDIYVANKYNDSVSVIHISLTNGSNDKKIKDIMVGKRPSSITADPGQIFVANEFNNTVSVINASNYKKLKDIPVGDGPISIARGWSNDKIYVANYGNNTVSVINGSNYNKIKDIPVGKGPISIAISKSTSKVYVGYTFESIVTVINASNDNKIKDIQVGDSPASIAIHDDNNMVYVANKGSNTVSVIDGSQDKVVSGITFNTSPANAGSIICDNNKEYPTNVYIYVAIRTICKAQPNKGFEFNSWTENLKHNSTIPINTSSVSNSPLNSFLSSFGIKQNDTSAYFDITRYGTFTANFKPLAPPIPAEYLVPLYGIIVSSIVGWSIPSIVGWINVRNRARRLNQYHKRIVSLYGDGELDEKDIGSLDGLKREILDAYSKGKLADQHYVNLKEEISVLYEEIYNKRLHSLIDISGRANKELFNRIKDDITDAYAKGKITEIHYELLTKKILDYENK
jgi:YVTN family beta-propeller protein